MPHSPSVFLFLALLAACGGGPPHDKAVAGITEAVLDANPTMWDGRSAAAEVVGIEVSAWTTDDQQAQGEPVSRRADWKAKLRFKEPIACVLEQRDGTRIVSIGADAGEELSFSGHARAMAFEGKWEVAASVANNDDFVGPGVWKKIVDKVPGLTRGYPVFDNGSSGNPVFRSVNFEPLSKLKPYVVVGSPEHKQLMLAAQEQMQKGLALAEERRRKAQDLAAAQQQQREAEQARIQAEAVEQQRLAREVEQRRQADAAEKTRLAVEEAKTKAEEQVRARRLGVMKPFQSGAGAVIAAEAGASMGTLVIDAAIDESKFAVSGHAVDLQQMPFEEFTYDGAVDERGTFTLRSSRAGDPVTYAATGEKLASRIGSTITGLSGPERTALEALLVLGKRLGAAPPLQLAVELLDSATTTAQEPQLALISLTGTVFYRGRVAPAVAPLFAADLTASKAYAWRNKEVVSIRLSEVAKGRGLYIRGTKAASTDLVVTVNGVHKATIASIPKLGAAIVTLPADLEVLDIRLEANGAVSSRTIGLIR